MPTVIWCLTTAIALFSVLGADYAPWQRRILPWTGGLLVGIGLFWILPEMAAERGWGRTLTGVAGILVLLALIDRYLYPLCPFCAAGVHAHAGGSHGHGIALGWPLLVFGCMHTFVDGWTIGLARLGAASNAAAALSWGATVHKIPESVAIGILAARLAPGRRTALAAVALIQIVMAGGILLSAGAGGYDSRWAAWSAMPACAFLLLFGLLALEQEWRQHGRAGATRAAAPGLVGCGLAALVSMIWSR